MRKLLVTLLLTAGALTASVIEVSAEDNGASPCEPEPIWGLWKDLQLDKPTGVFPGIGAPVLDAAPPVRELSPLFPFALPPHINLTAPAPIALQ